MTWKSYYRPIAERLSAYRHQREGLVDLLADVLYDTGASFPLTDLGEELIDIDPFTFFAAFNRKMNRTSRERLLRHVCIELGIHEISEIGEYDQFDVSDSERLAVMGPDHIDFSGAPAIPLFKARFFSIRQSQHLEIEMYWQLFELLRRIDAQKTVSEEQQQSIGAVLKDISAYNPSAKDKLQWAFCWLCPDSYQLLIPLLNNAGNTQYPTAEFSQALLEADKQELPAIDKQVFIDLVEDYVANREQFEDDQVKIWLTVKHFSENFNPDSSDFATMLINALTDDTSLLENTNNFYPYTEITRLARLEPECVHDAFLDLFDENDNLPARCLRFCNSITILHEKYRDRFAHWQIKPCAHANFFVASIYLFMYDPSTYFLYSPARAQMLSGAVGYQATFRPIDADVVEAYEEMCKQLIDCLAENPEVVGVAKASLEARTGFTDTHNHLLLDSIIVSSFGI